MNRGTKIAEIVIIINIQRVVEFGRNSWRLRVYIPRVHPNVSRVLLQERIKASHFVFVCQARTHCEVAARALYTFYDQARCRQIMIADNLRDGFQAMQ